MAIFHQGNVLNQDEVNLLTSLNISPNKFIESGKFSKEDYNKVTDEVANRFRAIEADIPRRRSEVAKSIINQYKPSDIASLPLSQQKDLREAYREVKSYYPTAKGKVDATEIAERRKVLENDLKVAYSKVLRQSGLRDVNNNITDSISVLAKELTDGTIKDSTDLLVKMTKIVKQYTDNTKLKGEGKAQLLEHLTNNILNVTGGKSKDEWIGIKTTGKGLFKKEGVTLTGDINRETVGDFFGNTLEGKKLEKVSYFKGEQGLPEIPDIPQESVDVLEGLIGAGEKKVAAEGEFETFKGGLQEELKRRRTALLEPEKALVGERLQEAIPEIEQQLHARGLLTSGELASEISRTGAGLQAGYESLQEQTENEDYNFFRDMSYNQAVTKALESGQDLSQYIATGQQFALQGQETAFKQKQAGLQSQFEQDIARRRGETQLYAQQEKQRLQREQEKKTKTQQLLGIGAEAVGQIASLPFLSSLSKGTST